MELHRWLTLRKVACLACQKQGFQTQSFYCQDHCCCLQEACWRYPNFEQLPSPKSVKEMDCFSSTIQEYQPILIGAGCLAFGYMYGRHCRSVMENPVAAPTMSDAACCAGTESFNYIPEPAAAAAIVDPETMAIVRQWLNPAEANYDSSDRELTEKPERCVKRDLEVVPRKKEDMIWNHNVSKKQKSAPAVMREVVRTKHESDQDSDDELLAQRLEFFTKSLSGTRASINNKKKKPSRANEDRHDIATSCEETKNAQEITARKGVARSLSGLGALASPQQEDEDDDQGKSSPGSSVEDTCRSPKTVRLGDDGDGDEEEEQEDEVLDRSCQVELAKKSTPETEAVALFRVSCTLSNTLHQLVGDNMSVSLMESKDHTGDENEGGECPNARMKVDAQKHVEPAVRLELPTSPPPELLLLHGEEEGKGVGEGDAVAAAPVPVIDKGVLLHAEIYKRLRQLPKFSAADNYEKKRSKASSSCFFGATTKPVRFRWLGKLTSSWRKRSKLWRHRYNNNSNSNSNSNSNNNSNSNSNSKSNNKQLHKQAALPAALAESSQSGLPEMASSCGAPEGTLSAECCNF